VTALINAIRSILFNLAFFLIMFIGCLCMLPMCLLPTPGPVRAVLGGTIHVVMFAARWIMGLRWEVRGADKLPPPGVPIILMSKHASNMDPYITWQARRDVTALAKKELFRIPIIGLVFKKIDVIKVDRAAGTAHRGLDQAADDIIKAGLALIVYPEATRVLPGKRRTLKAGGWHLQAHRDIPVYPIAFNTGCHWTRGFWHKPGRVILEVGDPFPKDLPKAEFMALVEKTVVQRSDEIMKECGADLPDFDRQPIK